MPLPTSDFEWVNEDKLDNLLSVMQETKRMNKDTMVRGLDERRRVGVFLEVDFHYPESIKEKTKDLPLAVEKLSVTEDMLSDNQADVYKMSYGRERVPASCKLLGTQNDKKNYIIHYKLLDLYLQLGLEVTKIHQGITFTESLFMKEWVDYCTKNRASAESAFYKAMWKLSVNSVYGKLCEDVRRRQNITIIRSYDQLLSYASKKPLKRMLVLEEDLALLSSYKTTV